MEIEPGAVLRLEQHGKELWLDARTGDFLMLYDRKNDRLLAGASGPQPLVAVQFKRAGEALWTEVGPDRAAVLKPKEQYALGPWHLETVSETEQHIEPEFVRLRDGAAEICHVFTAEGLGRARVTQVIAPAGEDQAATAVWNLDVTVEVLDGPADVVGVVYPRLPSVRIGECGRIAIQSNRTGFQADVRGSLLRLTRRGGTHEDHRWALDPKRPNEWQELGGEFTTPADLTGASLYLYNVRSPDTAWFGDIRLE